jgi:hypothetical protein
MNVAASSNANEDVLNDSHFAPLLKFQMKHRIASAAAGAHSLSGISDAFLYGTAHCRPNKLMRFKI